MQSHSYSYYRNGDPNPLTGRATLIANYTGNSDINPNNIARVSYNDYRFTVPFFPLSIAGPILIGIGCATTSLGLSIEAGVALALCGTATAGLATWLFYKSHKNKKNALSRLKIIANLNIEERLANAQEQGETYAPASHYQHNNAASNNRLQTYDEQDQTQLFATNSKSDNKSPLLKLDSPPSYQSSP